MILIDRPSAKRSLIGAFVALQIADILSTESALARHAGVEQNALMALAQDHLGSLWWGPKLAVALGCAVIMARFPHNRLLLIAPFVLLMAGIVVSNSMR